MIYFGKSGPFEYIEVILKGVYFSLIAPLIRSEDELKSSGISFDARTLSANALLFGLWLVFDFFTLFVLKMIEKLQVSEGLTNWGEESGASQTTAHLLKDRVTRYTSFQVSTNTTGQ